MRHFNGLLLIAALTWLAMCVISGLAQGIIARHPVAVEDNLQARRIQTQAAVLSRSAMVMVALAGAAMALMTFPGARQLGASLLASAGVLGIIGGIAARPVFSNLIAGLQLALAQPIRLDDVLIVKGEWGRVEEITGTYVVLKLWDERRLIVPLQWFIENPFENWTRSSAQILGTVMLYLDFAMPMAPLRAELERVVHAAPEWDKRVCMLQVTDASERAMQVRILVSAASAGQVVRPALQGARGAAGFRRARVSAVPPRGAAAAGRARTGRRQRGRPRRCAQRRVPARPAVRDAGPLMAQTLALGPLTLPLSLLLALAVMVLGPLAGQLAARRVGLDLESLLFRMMVAGLVVARLGLRRAVPPGSYLQSPWSILDIRDGGWAPLAGMAAAATAAIVVGCGAPRCANPWRWPSAPRPWCGSSVPWRWTPCRTPRSGCPPPACTALDGADGGPRRLRGQAHGGQPVGDLVPALPGEMPVLQQAQAAGRT